MTGAKKFEYLIFGLILIILGIVFLINNFYPDLEIWSKLVKLWPIILIIYGIKKIYLAFIEVGKRDEG